MNSAVYVFMITTILALASAFAGLNVYAALTRRDRRRRQLMPKTVKRF
jgi:hypothetical protein